MSNFLPTIKKTYSFQSDEVEIEFSRLTRGQMLKLSPLIPEVTGRDEEGKPLIAEQTSKESMALLDAALDILAVNVATFTGLKDANGAEITFDTAVGQSYFTSLFTEVVMDLITGSMVVESGESEGKKEEA